MISLHRYASDMLTVSTVVVMNSESLNPVPAAFVSIMIRVHSYPIELFLVAVPAVEREVKKCHTPKWRSYLFKLSSMFPHLRLCNAMVSLQGLSNIAWACARMRIQTPIIGAVAAESVARLDNFTPQGVSNLCWALAKLDASIEMPILAALEQHAIHNFPDYGGQAMSMTLWGLARQGYQPTGLTQLVFTEIRNCCVQFSPDCITAVICAMAELKARDTEVITAVTKQCIDNLELYENDPHLLCSILWAVAVLDAPGQRCEFRPVA